MNSMFECNLQLCLAHDLEAWKKGVKEKPFATLFGKEI